MQGKKTMDWKKLLTAAALSCSVAGGASTLALPAHADSRNGNYSDRDLRNLPNFSKRATVTRVSGGNRFEIRDSDGNTFRVAQPSGAQPSGLSVGDRVEVSGKRDGDLVIASSVTILRDNTNNNGNNNGTFRGIVTDDQSGDFFQMRTDNNRIIRVRARNGEPRRLSRGDRVEVTGNWNNRDSTLVADSVRILNDNNSNSNNGNGIQDFQGIVRSMDSRRRFIVRRDNGRDVTVYSSDEISRNIRVGDRVRVVGRNDNGIVRASSVNETGGNSSGGFQNNSFVDFRGTIAQAPYKGNRTYRVRADNGSTYVVQARSGDDNFRVNDRVRVRGKYSRGTYAVVTATNIDRL